MEDNQSPLRKLADNDVLVIVARTMAAIGVPICGFLFLQMWNGIQDLKSSFATSDKAVAVHEVRISLQDIVIKGLGERMTRVEDKLLGKGN